MKRVVVDTSVFIRLFTKDKEKNMKFADAVISSWTLYKEMDKLITFVEDMRVKIL